MSRICKNAGSLPIAERTRSQVIAGNKQAQRLFPILEPCEVCQSPKTERHHRDADTWNNTRSNIQFLCHKHHVAVDRRWAKLAGNMRLVKPDGSWKVRYHNQRKDDHMVRNLQSYWQGVEGFGEHCRSVRQVAEELSLHPMTVRRIVNSRKLGTMVDGALILTPNDIAAVRDRQDRRTKEARNG